MKYSLRLLRNKNLFRRHKYRSPNCIEYQMFLDPQLHPLGFLGITKLSNPSQENGMPKKRLDAALRDILDHLSFSLIYRNRDFGFFDQLKVLHF